MTAILIPPSSSLLRQRNDSELVMASAQPSSGKPVRGRQDPEREEWDSEPASTRATGAYRSNSETVVHLSKVNSGTRETGTRVYIKKVVPMHDRNWITIRAFHANERNSLSSNISKMVTRMVRHHDQDERDHDGTVHWDTIYPVQQRNFEDKIGRRCTYKDWIEHIHFGSRKTRFEYCLHLLNSIVYSSHARHVSTWFGCSCVVR